MSTTFHTPINNVATTVGSAYTAGSGSLVVATGTGSKFGSTFPLIITASRAGAVLSILNVTGRSTDTLAISGALEGASDVNLSVGDAIEMRPTALAITELQDAVNARAERSGASFTGNLGLAGYNWAITTAGD